MKQVRRVLLLLNHSVPCVAGRNPSYPIPTILYTILMSVKPRLWYPSRGRHKTP